MSIQRVLIADDDSLSREFLSEACKTFGFQVDSVTTGEQALERLRKGGIDMVLTDLRMPGISGVDLIRTMGREFADVPVVLVTAHGTIETAVQALQAGAQDFLVKPVSTQALDVVIKRVMRTRRLERENEYLRAEAGFGGVEDIVSESRSMQELLRKAERVAGSKGTVLITGESGTGKEKLAQFLHTKSPRNTGPFIRVNCAALSEQLLESELFGHERGAFTGAHKRKEGRFELADGGTLLLDEIGEISPALQAKLLRVLEEEEFERVGGTTTLKVDVRVIATTNRNLPDEVSRGHFREDLFYRLHVLPLEISPLRERPEDVLPLARHFAESCARANGLAVPSIGLEAEKRLQEWHWPFLTLT
jgi:DNA-binding NtrC family response regulator